MGLNGVLRSFKNASGTVTRATASTYDSGGHRVAGTATTIPVDGVIEPAIGESKVIGGRNQNETEQGQDVDDVRVFWTKTELKTRTPTTEPDYLTFTDGELLGTWEVFRVVNWNLGGRRRAQIHWKVTLTRTTKGAS